MAQPTAGATLGHWLGRQNDEKPQIAPTDLKTSEASKAMRNSSSGTTKTNTRKAEKIENGEKETRARAKLIERINELTKNIKALTKEKEEINAKLDTTSSERDLLKRKLEEKVAELSEKNSELEKEREITLASKNITDLKEQLTSLNMEISDLVHSILKAVIKNEGTEKYASNNECIYKYAEKAFKDITLQSTTLYQKIQKDKKTILDTFIQRDTLENDWNDSLVLSERADHILKLLGKTYTTPHHLKIFSDKVERLLINVNELIKRDYIDTKSYQELNSTIQNTNLNEQERFVVIKNSYSTISDEKRNALLKAEKDSLFSLLNEIKEFKKNYLDNIQSAETKLTTICEYLAGLNINVKYWKELTTSLDNYQIYRDEKREDLVIKLKKTQRLLFHYYSELRDWSSFTWNKALNNLKLLECKLHLLADKNQVIDEMVLTLGEIGILKNNAKNTYRVGKAENFETELQVLKIDFDKISENMKLHHNRYLTLRQTYITKISDLTKKLAGPSEVTFKDEFDDQTTNSQLLKEIVLKDIIDTHTTIKQLTESQLANLESQWYSLFTKQFFDTAADLDKINNRINSSGFFTRTTQFIGSQVGLFSAGAFTKVYNDILQSPLSKNGTPAATPASSPTAPAAVQN